MTRPCRRGKGPPWNHRSTALRWSLLLRYPRRPGIVLFQALQEGTGPRVVPVDEHAGGGALPEVPPVAGPVPLGEVPQADQEVGLTQLRPRSARGLQQVVLCDQAAVVIEVFDVPVVVPEGDRSRLLADP